MPTGTPAVTVQRRCKPWYRSKTVLLNAAALVLAIAEVNLGVLQPLLPVNVYALLAFLLPIANGLLRMVTNQPVALRPARTEWSGQ